LIAFATLLLLLFRFQSSPAQVTFSEVMFDPAGPESTDEFIELLNLSETDSIDLTGWWLSDGRAVDSLRGAGAGLVLAPGQFALVLDPGYFDRSSTYDDLIPQNALVITIDNATFGSGGLSNSVARALVLGDAGGDTVSVYTYSLGNTPGHSDEKIDPAGGNSAENWADSRVFNGTPGAPNSVTPLEFDLALGPSLVGWRPERPRAGQVVEIEIQVANLGLRPVEAYRLTIYEDANRDSIVTESELLLSAEGGPLAPRENEQLSLRWQNVEAGYHSLLVDLDFPGDLRAENNTVWIELVVGFPSQALVINEFMYRPLSGEPEWIELFNPGSQPVSLRGWLLSDANVDRPALLAEQDLVIGPKGYCVIAPDAWLGPSFPDLVDSVIVPRSRFPTLNNGEDEILLFDPLGFTIDSVAYSSKWGSQAGRSLEKIWFERSATDPANWALSVDSLGATPGRANSVSPRNFDVGILAEEILFYPEQPGAGETVLLTVPLRNLGRESVEQIEVIVYDDVDGDLLPGSEEEIARRPVSATLASEELLNVEFDLGELTSGWHPLVIEVRLAGDQRPENNLARVELAVGYPARALVINEIMFETRSGQSEWVELYNRSSEVVDLRAWQFADSSALAQLPQDPLYLEPGGFAVLAADSSLIEEYGVLDALLITMRDFPSLNNSADVVEVRDMYGNRIDAVRYRGAWGAGPGISLERLHPELTSDDSTTWYPSVAPTGATPGKPNSIYTEVQPTGTELAISPNPFSPDGDGIDDFAVVSFRLPEPMATVNLKIYDMRGRLVRQLLNNAPTGAERHVVWDGLNERGERLRVGIYIVYLEAIRPEVGFLRSAKKTVVLARRLR
jgi:hypothetical protein